MFFRSTLVGLLLLTWTAHAGQPTRQPVPTPFPRPAEPETKPAEDPAKPAQVPAQPPAPAAAPAGQSGEPNEATLGFPLYPEAQFLTSFDAGRGQRYYLFGTNASFPTVVVYYRAVLKERGNLVFDSPATHMFEIGRFREETMAFPPGVTVKDYTWSGSEGYLHVRPGVPPTRYKTVIQIVPVPPDAGR